MPLEFIKTIKQQLIDEFEKFKPSMLLSIFSFCTLRCEINGSCMVICCHYIVTEL